MTARTVDWFRFHQWVTERQRVDSWPLVGTLAWFGLPDGHPAKDAAVLAAASHWALRIESNQAALAQASKDIAGAADWSAVASEYLTLRRFRDANPWADRQAVQR